MLTVGGRLKAERERLGLSQIDFSGIGGVSKVSQFNYESDKRSPDATYLAAIAAAGVDVQYVITGVRSALSRDELAPQEGALIEKYRLLSDSDKAHAQAVVGAFADKGDCGKQGVK